MSKDIYNKIKEESKLNTKNKSSDVKALFSQRLLAFVIDFVIFTFIAAIITSFIPVNNTASKLYEEQSKILDNYISGSSNMEDYVNQMIDIEYNISKYTVVSSLVTIVISLVYYVIYPCYNNGQTFGKKLLKIKIKKVNDKELTMNDLLIRSMINNSILVNIISIGFVLLLSKDLYLLSSSFINVIQCLVLIISLIMVAFTKKSQGLHDKVVNTEVVMTNTMKEDILCQIEN